MFGAICTGGTFDHIHSGHRLLLTQAALLTKDRLLIGVTGDELLKKKKYAEVLENFEKRAQSVREFLTRLMGPDKTVFDIFELNDPAGKAATDDTLDAIILTPEVAKGGDFINNARKENGLPELPLVFVDMIMFEDSVDEKFSNKMSSSLIRKYLMEKKQN